MHWKDGHLYDGQTVARMKIEGGWQSNQSEYLIHVMARFDSANDNNPTWWYEPKIQHRSYPIDLLPNFGLKQPTPIPLKTPLESFDHIYWAVRNPAHELPDIVRCDLQLPKDAPLFPEVLIAAAAVNVDIGNTCRGSLQADNGMPLFAIVDVPGGALKDIDRIYAAVAKRLSNLAIEQ
ncbi:hypothetical protein LXT13_27680 [Pelomonas sp. P8]|uniref:Uncharacterized protein n=2 Tax=Pelomonas cellulosilytica TaxID=2906762 RepID=A0ABS8Y007_9BURK|nr:hypothetical protein [Pelomonas sp. P8]